MHRLHFVQLRRRGLAVVHVCWTGIAIQPFGATVPKHLPPQEASAHHLYDAPLWVRQQQLPRSPRMRGHCCSTDVCAVVFPPWRVRIVLR